MAGGSDEDIARAKTVFGILGKSFTHVGPVGAGQITKAANQAIVGVTLSVVAEAVLLSRETGANPTKMREALLGGFAGSRILELHGQRMIDRSFDPGGRARTQAKDLNQIVDLANSVNLTLPVIEHCRDLWNDMVELGMGEFDQSGYLAFAEALQGMSLK